MYFPGAPFAAIPGSAIPYEAAIEVMGATPTFDDDDDAQPFKISKPAPPEVAGMEANILQEYGISPENLKIGPDGYVKLSKEERGRIIGNSMAMLGAGILQGAASGSWEGVAKGLSGGMAAATESANKGRQEASDNRIKNELTRIQATGAVLSAETAKYNLESAKEAKAEKERFEKELETGITPLINILNKGIDGIEIPDDVTDPRQIAALNTQKQIYKMQIKRARLMIASGDLESIYKGIDIIENVTPKIPGIAEPLNSYMALQTGKNTAAAQGAGMDVASKRVAGVAKANNLPVTWDAEGRLNINTEERRAALRATNANADANIAQALYYSAGGGAGGGLKPDSLTDADSVLYIKKEYEDTMGELTSSATAINNAANQARAWLDDNLAYQGKNYEKISDADLLKDSFTPGTQLYKDLNSSSLVNRVNGSSSSYYQMVASSLGAKTAVPSGPGMHGALVQSVGNQFSNIENIMKRRNVQFDKNGKPLQDITNADVRVELAQQAVQKAASEVSFGVDRTKALGQIITNNHLQTLKHLSQKYGKANLLALVSDRTMNPEVQELIIAIRDDFKSKENISKPQLERALQAGVINGIRSYIISEIK